MHRNPEPYIPNTKGEFLDLLASMILSAPTFIDKSGHFPEQDIDTEFFALNAGLKAIKKSLGEDDYTQAVELSAKARAHFEADPDDRTDDGIKGRDCLIDIEEILRKAGGRKR